MEAYAKVQQAIVAEIKSFFKDKGVELLDATLERPVALDHGDLTTSVALKCAKSLGKAPLAIAEELAAYLEGKKIQFVAKVSAVRPGFVNFSLDHEFFRNLLEDISITGEKFGDNSALNGLRWVVEHTSPNPNKAMHLGHLRNNIVGMSILHVLEHSGATVTSEAIDNNRGIAIAKLMWGFLARMKKNPDAPTDIAYWSAHKSEWYTPEEAGLSPDRFVSKCYAMGEEEGKKDSTAEGRTRALVVSWENNDALTRELWAHVLSYSYLGMERTLARLGSSWEHVWHEHEHYQKGKSYIEEGLAKGKFKKLEDGAVLSDLAAYDLPDTILLKNDGTSLYITQDIALTALKKERYKESKLLWVVGPDQTLAMRQLFAICEQLGIGKLADFIHIPYGYVSLKDKDGGVMKMSSRDGTVILIDDLIDTVKEKILQRFSESEREVDEKLRGVAETMALGAVKFSLLKSDRTVGLVFDPEQSIATSGDSGIYVLYVYVRTQSILRKGKEMKVPPVAFPQTFGKEEHLVRQLLLFPDAIARAREDLSAHHIAQYLLLLCAAFNSWYGEETIVDGGERMAYKLKITESVGVAIKNALLLLGISVVEEI